MGVQKRFTWAVGRRKRVVLLCGAAVLTSACAVGPNYRRPAADVSGNFKEQEGWKPSEPADAISRGNWWEIFNDPVLNELEAQVNISNQTVLSAGAAVEQSRALVDEANAGFWPTLGVTGSTTHSRAGAFPVNKSSTLGGQLSWALDIWGQLRRSAEGSRASWQASEAALAAARLSAQSELAIDYFQLRAQDQNYALLEDTVEGEKKSLDITQSRYRTGVAARTDVVTAQVQLLGSQAQLTNNAVQRGILEHAIAVLVGKQPSELSIKPAAMRTDVPTVPAGVPSSLLERRPDVAEAERRVASANAQIGVAIAAWFPSLTLGGNLNYAGPTVGRLVSLPNQVWSVGPTLALNLLDGGLRRAQVKGARASYVESVDNYRQTVLSGIQQVEDELVTLRVLEKEAVIEDEAVKAAREAEGLTLAQYKAGTVNYINVIQAQTTRLSAEQTALNVFLTRLTASVTLIEALGGGWDSAELDPHHSAKLPQP
jgi:NodT family efflux transporter outer membrane factor (OMF) lipoprotein